MKLDAEQIRRMLAEDEFGLLNEAPKSVPMTSDDRLIAGFLEIVDFVDANGRVPESNPADISEFKLAARLRAMSANDEHREALLDHDTHGLLKEPEPPASIADLLASDDMGLLDDGVDIHTLTHVPKTQASPDKVAQRKPCDDFENFKPLFDQCHADLRTGRRKLLEFRNPRHIEEGKFFVMSGMLVYVAEVGELHTKEVGKDGRTRCVFDNGTEADLLLRSLARQLYNDGRLVTEPADVTRDRMEVHPDAKIGSVYVLRSLSDDEQVRSIENLHKIGSTSGTAGARVAGADKHATFLNAPVEVLAEYRLPAAAVRTVEDLLHKFFGAVRLDVWFENAGQNVAEANEWFDVPLSLIDEAIELISAETITNFRYDAEDKKIQLAE